MIYKEWENTNTHKAHKSKNLICANYISNHNSLQQISYEIILFEVRTWCWSLSVCSSCPLSWARWWRAGQAAQPHKTEPAEAAAKLRIYSSSSGLGGTSDCPGTASSLGERRKDIRQCVTNKMTSIKMMLVKIWFTLHGIFLPCVKTFRSFRCTKVLSDTNWACTDNF